MATTCYDVSRVAGPDSSHLDRCAWPQGVRDPRSRNAGRGDLRDWIDRDEHVPGREAELVKVFSLGEVEPAAARAYFFAREERSAAKLGHLQRMAEQVPWDGGDPDVFARLALEFGLRYREMVREWGAGRPSRSPTDLDGVEQLRRYLVLGGRSSAK